VTATLLRITVGHLLGQRRFFAMSGLMLIPIGIALLYRLAADPDNARPATEFTPIMIRALIVTLLLPLVSLVLGTAALGSEIEDGTAVYLLATPIERWRIVLIKTLVAAAAAAAMLVPATLVTALVALGGEEQGLALGFAAAVGLGAIVYSAAFVALSVLTSRALLIGLGYVFVWEAIVTNLFAGTRWVSNREYALGVGAHISSAPPDAFGARLDGTSALIAAAIVTGGAFVLAVRWLGSFEIGERT
jgi:ABC-2 type transport system permease protein